MELSASITVILASQYGIPVSTTMCITGSTVGVALCNGDWRATNWRAIGWIYAGWIATIPVAVCPYLSCLLPRFLIQIFAGNPLWMLDGYYPECSSFLRFYWALFLFRDRGLRLSYFMCINYLGKY